MRTIIKVIAFLAFTTILVQSVYGQNMSITAEMDGNDVVVKLMPSGGDITAQWIDIEVFLRQDVAMPAPSFGAPVVNATDFPGVQVPFNGIDQQGAEAGYRNFWFGTSYAATPSNTYTAGAEYELFRVDAGGDPATMGLEVVFNENFFPTYATVTDGSATEYTNPTAPFYGTGASSCTVCPGAETNYFVPVQVGLPIELLSFDVSKKGEDAALVQWTTSSEQNTSHFEIERSID
ncbi:MAG: hypothetical protein HKN16_06335, partial [Saprospiraceae bacterium]|nr:hypothetical protein [Saprospiraceae bacterium]